MSGLVEILHQLEDEVDLADLADELTLEVDDLLPLVDALALLGLVEVEAGRVRLTVEGIGFAGADIQESKRAFAHAVRERVPLVRLITSSLDRSADGRLPAGFFRDLLRRSLSEEESSRQLELAIDWGRYAGLLMKRASTAVDGRVGFLNPGLPSEPAVPQRRGGLGPRSGFLERRMGWCTQLGSARKDVRR
jgi:hypothetical protein